MSNQKFLSKEALLIPGPEEQANLIYALGEAFSQLALHHSSWAKVLQREAIVGEMVMIRFMRTSKPIEHIGRLVFDGWVLIPQWGPVACWDKQDQEAYKRGERVGQQREWHIMCIDGVVRRYTNVSVTRLPTVSQIPHF